MTDPVSTRSRRIYIYWCVALSLLLVLGLVCWKVEVPVWRVRAAIVEFHRRAHLGSPEGDYLGGLLLTKYFYRPLVKELGGPKNACSKLGWYVRMPDGAVPHRDYATRALGLCEKAAVTALECALTDSNGEIRWAAANALEWIGPDAAEAIPALEKALKDEQEPVRQAAAEALKKIRAAGKKGAP